MQDGVNLGAATILAGLFMANIAGIITGYVSMRVAIARLEVMVDKLETDVNALGGKIRKNLS